MKKSVYLGLLLTVGLSGCISANPVVTEPAIEKIADNAELYNQRSIDIAANELLLNILRARDHSPRAYTSISDVSMTPGGDFKSSIEAGGLGRGAAWSGIGGSVSSSSNDKLSYTLANASKSDGKNFADQRFDATTFNEFWRQPWPRAMLLHIFFEENAFEIVQTGTVAEGLKEHYRLGPVRPGLEARNVGQEPFYVMSDNGKLTYCLNALEACIEAKPKPKDTKSKDATAQEKLENVSVDVAVTLEAKKKSESGKSEFLWKSSLAYGQPNANYAIRVADDYLEPKSLVDEVLYENGVSLNKYKLIYCSSFDDISLITDRDYQGKARLGSIKKPKYRSVGLFKCSDTLSDVSAELAQPYFIVANSASEVSIYQPKLSTFDNAIYLLGRSLRSQSISKFKTEERYCNPFLQNKMRCDQNKSLLRLYTKQDDSSKVFGECAARFVADVSYRGETYRAGLPELGDNLDNKCIEGAMSSTTLILLSKIVDYSIQRPEISTQLLLTQ